MKKFDNVTTRIAIIAIAITTILCCYIVCGKPLVKVEKVVEVVYVDKNTAEEVNSEEEIVYSEDTKEEENSIEESKEEMPFIIKLLLYSMAGLMVIVVLTLMGILIKLAFDIITDRDTVI